MYELVGAEAYAEGEDATNPPPPDPDCRATMVWEGLLPMWERAVSTYMEVGEDILRSEVLCSANIGLFMDLLAGPLTSWEPDGEDLARLEVLMGWLAMPRGKLDSARKVRRSVVFKGR